MLFSIFKFVPSFSILTPVILLGSITSCILHNNTKLIVQSAFNNCKLLQYNEYDNAYYLANDNTPYALLIKPKNDFITSCIIHNDTTLIFDSAFYRLTSLTSVTIPDGITSIADDAFSGCYNLNSITIGSGVTSIGKNAFSDCSSLRYVYITDLAAWCNIDFEDFVSNPLYYGINLYLNGNLVTELIIPEGVTAIKNYAFQSCLTLTSVTIPDSVTSIGEYAFYNCSKLTSIHFTGTKAEWKAISKGYAWNTYTGSFTVYCSDGNLTWSEA